MAATTGGAGLVVAGAAGGLSGYLAEHLLPGGGGLDPVDAALQTGGGALGRRVGRKVNGGVGRGGSGWHWHWGEGPGLQKWHLPYQLGNWPRNFNGLLGRGQAWKDLINMGAIGAAGLAKLLQKLGLDPNCGCEP